MSAESKSPFGEVDGFMISGVSREQDRVIRVVVRITTDGGLNSFLMTECADSSTLEWEGTGKMTFTMRHKEQRLEMVMTCLHDAEEKVLRVSPVVYCRPFGWVRLRDQKLLLDRGSVAYSVPVDIEEERLSSSAHAVEEPTLETELNNLRRLHSHMGVSQDRDQTVNSPTDYANLPSTRLSRWKPVNSGGASPGCQSGCGNSIEMLRSSAPYSRSTLASQAAVGLRLRILKAPAVAFWPKYTGCGPFKTSMLSRSMKASLICDDRPKCMPSRKVGAA